jgi:hypothetical protein
LNDEAEVLLAGGGFSTQGLTESTESQNKDAQGRITNESLIYKDADGKIRVRIQSSKGYHSNGQLSYESKTVTVYTAANILERQISRSQNFDTAGKENNYSRSHA